MILLKRFTNYAYLEISMMRKDQCARDILCKFRKYCRKIGLISDMPWLNLMQKDIVSVKLHFPRSNQAMFFSNDFVAFNPCESNRTSACAVSVGSFKINRERLHPATPNGEVRRYNQKWAPTTNLITARSIAAILARK